MKTNDCIFFQLSRVSRAAARYWHKKLASLNVTSAQALVLLFLAEKDKVTAKYLGQKLEFDSATLTGLIDRMTRAGLLERQAHPQDRRAILVCLTPQGRKSVKQILAMVEKDNQAFLSDLTDEEGMILSALLKKIG